MPKDVVQGGSLDHIAQQPVEGLTAHREKIMPVILLTNITRELTTITTNHCGINSND